MVARISVVLPILVPTPFLRSMTRFCIETLREHADQPFQLIVVEAQGRWFDPAHHDLGSAALYPDSYLSFSPPKGSVKEFNAGTALAEGEFILSLGNDVFMPPHWDTELLRCFADRPDCGVASLSAFERGAVIGPPEPVDMIVEGHYSPIMMFRSADRMDEAYRKIYCDSDFIMRVYERGQRSYRSCRAHAHHLLRMTTDRVNPAQHALDLAHDERLFYQRWGKSPLAIFAMLRAGGYIFGREYESFLRPINLHYDPNT